jgi:hypothetical protein
VSEKFTDFKSKTPYQNSKGTNMTYGDQHTFHLLAGGRSDRSGQQLIGRRGRRRAPAW